MYIEKKEWRDYPATEKSCNSYVCINLESLNTLEPGFVFVLNFDLNAQEREFGFEFQQHQTEEMKRNDVFALCMFCADCFHHIAYFLVHSRASSLYFSRSVLYILAISGTNGSSGFGSHKSEQIDKRTETRRNRNKLVYQDSLNSNGMEKHQNRGEKPELEWKRKKFPKIIY